MRQEIAAVLNTQQPTVTECIEQTAETLNLIEFYSDIDKEIVLMWNGRVMANNQFA